MKVLKFVQAGCMPCKTLSQMIDTMGVQVEEVQINNSNREEIVTKYGIMSTPTMIGYDEDGNEIKRMSGANFSQVKEFFGV